MICEDLSQKSDVSQKQHLTPGVEVTPKFVFSQQKYRNVPIRSALPNRSAPQMSLHIVTE